MAALYLPLTECENMKSNKSDTRHVKRVAQATPDLTKETLAGLKDLIPQAFVEGKIDFAKLRESLGDEVDERAERYSFTWAGKRDAIRLLQTPSRATLVPVPKESVNFGSTNNVFIEGENLEVLKLLYKSYAGRVNMIYIDPPYNTGKDFIYPDNFVDPLDTYLKVTGQKDSEGNLLTSNPETSGRFHSSWLSMMYPRLFVARQLLTEDGLIAISIDDGEASNLRLLLNEVFGEENFISQITWQNVYGGGAKSKYVVPQHEYIMLYGKSIANLGEIELPPDPEAKKRYTERDAKYAVRGPYFTQPLATTSMDERPNLRFPIYWKEHEIWPEKQWQWSRERVESALASDELVIRNDSGKWSVRYKQYLKDEQGLERGSKLNSVLKGPWSQEGTAEIKEFFGDNKVFEFPKPSGLIKQLISSIWKHRDAIVLDFFSGSCSTAQALLELNRECTGKRSFIMVQYPEPTSDGSAALKAGFKTISDIGMERIRRVIKKLKKEAGGQHGLFKNLEFQEDLGFCVFKLVESNYRAWRGVEYRNGEKYAEEMDLFCDPLLPGWKPINVIYEVALKEGYSLTSSVDAVKGLGGNTIYRVTDADKGQSFLICLDDKIKSTTVKALGLKKDDLFICRDVALTDEQAANLALQCYLKTI
jgi:adenine-specific DNA-methyltransferase